MAHRITQEDQWDQETIDYVGSVMGGNPDWQDGGGGGGDSMLGTSGWWWSRHTMRVLRRLVPAIDALDGYAMSEAVMAADYFALESAICGEIEDLLGPNYPPSLLDDVVIEILHLLQLEMHRADQSFLEEFADAAAEEAIVDELERRSTRHADGEEAAEMCSICLEGLYQENENVAALDCEHEYHVRCIKEWLVRGKNECPLCRGTALMSCAI